MIQEAARAKINLTLHVGRVIEDHSDPYYLYHPLDSLVVFADLHDRLSAEPAEKMGLVISGPFADEIPPGEDNLVLRAIRAVQRATHVPPTRFHLEKNLPIAAGIGGGSANAAATLRILKTLVEMDEEAHWQRIALGLGADVPVCVKSVTCRMTGMGETVTPLPDMGTLSAVLVNPRIPVPTADVYALFDEKRRLELPKPQVAQGPLLMRTRAGNNDLQPMAERIAPIITQLIDELNRREGCQMARMSGSGATCFGIFRSESAAARAAEVLQSDHLDWWVCAVRLGDTAV